MSALLSLPCEAQSELLSYLAPRPLCSSTTSSAKSLGTSRARAYRSPGVPENVPPGACAGSCSWCWKRTPSPFASSAPISTPASALPEPRCSPGAAAAAHGGSADLLRQQGDTGSAGTHVTTRACSSLCFTAEHHKGTSQAVKISEICKEMKVAASGFQASMFSMAPFLGTEVKTQTTRLVTT